MHIIDDKYMYYLGWVADFEYIVCEILQYLVLCSTVESKYSCFSNEQMDYSPQMKYLLLFLLGAN